MRKVRVVGAAMTRFGKYVDRDLRDLAEEAVRNATQDAGLDLKEVEAAYVGNSVAGLITGQETIRGQVVLRKTGILGVPIVNVENACASASTAFHLGWIAVASGLYDCVLALGVEKLSDPDKAKSFRAFNSAVDIAELAEIEKKLGRSGEEAKERSLFMDLYLSMLNPDEPASQEVVAGITREQMALVSVKNHYHGSL
ncbi:MAG: thiolase family protein, partial [Chloroflexi bacterium]